MLRRAIWSRLRWRRAGREKVPRATGCCQQRVERRPLDRLLSREGEQQEPADLGLFAGQEACGRLAQLRRVGLCRSLVLQHALLVREPDGVEPLDEKRTTALEEVDREHLFRDGIRGHARERSAHGVGLLLEREAAHVDGPRAHHAARQHQRLLEAGGGLLPNLPQHLTGLFLRHCGEDFEAAHSISLLSSRAAG